MHCYLILRRFGKVAPANAVITTDFDWIDEADEPFAIFNFRYRSVGKVTECRISTKVCISLD